MIRRELIKFAGGAATGLAFTPLPWRLLGDSAIWTQNWSWMPRTPRGEVGEKEANCTLCPAGCAVKVRTCGGTPIGVWPRGEAMCPAGIAGHTLPWHPLRLRQCLNRGRVSSLEEALEASRAAAEGGLAVLDMLPGRTASLLHRVHLSGIANARYIPAPQAEGGTARAMARLAADPVQLSAELGRAKTVLSVSTPLLDGWAAPRRTAANRGFTLWQAESWRSRTMDLADSRLLIRPGSETALLLGLARQFLQTAGVERRARLLQGFDQLQAAIVHAAPAETAERTGLSEDRIAALADALLRERPSLVVADGDPLGGPLPEDARLAAAAVNVLLGAEAFSTRREPPVPKPWRCLECTPLEQVDDHAIGLLIIDEPAPGLALPWAAIAPKLKPEGALVVALTWNRASYARRADWLVPVPVYLESAADAPPPPDTGSWRMAVSPAVLNPPEGAIAAADFVARLAGAEPDSAARLEERQKLAGEEELEAAPAPAFTRILPAGTDGAQLAAAAAVNLEGPPVAAHGWRQASVSPLLGKLWQEWDLRPAPGAVTGHPETLRRLGWHADLAARLESEAGQMQVLLDADPAAPSGIIALSAGPAYAQICEAAPNGAWRLKNPKVVRS